jgi:hypothetical protein
MRIEIGKFVLEVDSERTKRTYLEIQKGNAERCGCVYCRNYLAAFEQCFPDEVLKFFSNAGIDPKKDAEVYELGEIATGIRLYGGEYYLWGVIITKPNGKQVLSKRFKFEFSQPSILAQDQFQSEGSLRFEFNAELPWILVNENA